MTWLCFGTVTALQKSKEAITPWLFEKSFAREAACSPDKLRVIRRFKQ